MPKDDPDDEKPSKLALENAREIGELSSGLKRVSGEISDIHRILERMNDRISRPPNTSLYIGIAGIFLAGIPIVAALIYFVVTSTVAPISERLVKVEQSEQVASDHAWDNFELEIRDDQALIDSGLKANETDTVMNTDHKNQKNKKHHPKAP